MATADLAQIRALVAAYAGADDTRRVLALRAEPTWAGPERIDNAARPIHIEACRSPLAVREALARHRNGELLVVLTDCTGADLGLDVRARLVKGDVLPLDPFSSVLALFRARVVDPQLVSERWLIEDLISLAPATGWATQRPAGDVLDVDVAWRTWHEARLGLAEEPADLSALVAIGAQPEVAAALQELPAERRERVAARWARHAGPVTPVIVDLLVEGRGAEIVAIGLAAGPLWAATDRSDLATTQVLARARLEAIFGRDRLTPTSAAAWAATAGDAVASSPHAAHLTDAAERLLTDADAAELAVLSDVLPSGFDLRLGQVARALAAGDLAEATAQLEHTSRHRAAPRRQHRLDAAAAAVRLLRRRDAGRRPEPTTFAAAAADYAADGAFVDEVVRLLDDGDSIPELVTAYAALTATASEERTSTTGRFVTLLAEWTQSEPAPDDRIIPIEDLLARVVAPVAADAPVLFVICDGMGLPVGHELLRDLLVEQWAPAVPAGQPGWPVGVALLPTVTDVSRTSMLSGARTVGGQAEERSGFTTHPALRAASSPQRPPVLFHKAALVGPSGTALADEVRQHVADPDQRIVGVVVNAIDDHLARGDQVRVGWDLSTLRPLGWLLEAAAEAGRVVVLSADHGHVLHQPDAVLRQRPGGGERWRTPPPGPEDGEVELAGPRVLRGDGRVVLPTDARLRYGGYKHGYHGGATPEEVLVPVEVLARRLPDGWEHRPLPTPAWWADELTPASVMAATPTPAPATRPSRPGRQETTLFDADAPTSTTTAGWIERLLTSDAFVEHRQHVRMPRPIADDRLRTYLTAIDANGGTIPLAALAAHTGEPADTLRMALTLVQRLLNLDGAEVLAVRAEGTVELNRPLAALQFGIEP